MKAKNKEEFKQSWNEHIDTLTLLVNSVKDSSKNKTLEKIKTIQSELRKIVLEGATDTFGYD